MGFGFGGEWIVGVVFIGEVIKVCDCGKVVGLVQFGWVIGWGFIVIFYLLMFSLLLLEEVWCVLFMFGLLLVLFVLVVCWLVKELVIYCEVR